ncbi:MAG: hypothetical protein M3M96_01625 [Candidatus Eremiobacteraeota bacterium]|nr:hypothetical protein [Candidatus Eremiobacteraeota bacterium]
MGTYAFMNVYVKSALLGVTSGLRTSAGPYAAQQMTTGKLPAKNAMALGGEMVADKLPFIGSRTGIPQLVARAGAAVYAAKTASKEKNLAALAVAAGAAIGASFLAKNLRGALSKRLGIPQQGIGLIEDAIVVGLIYAASRAADS